MNPVRAIASVLTGVGRSDAEIAVVWKVVEEEVEGGILSGVASML